MLICFEVDMDKGGFFAMFISFKCRFIVEMGVNWCPLQLWDRVWICLVWWKGGGYKRRIFPTVHNTLSSYTLCIEANYIITNFGHKPLYVYTQFTYLMHIYIPIYAHIYTFQHCTLTEYTLPTLHPAYTMHIYTVQFLINHFFKCC